MSRIVPQVSIGFAALLALAVPASAKDVGDEDWPWRRAGFYLGGFLTGNKTELELTEDSTGAGVVLDIEDLFGSNADSSVFRLGGYWRTSDNMRHSLLFEYYGSRTSATTTLEQDITINDTTFPAGSELEYDSNFDLFKLSYGYSFLLDERIDMAATIGLYTMPFGFEFQGVTSTESQDIVAPLPVIGLHSDVVLGDDFYLVQRLDLFFLAVDNFKGALVDAYLGVEWLPWEHVGFGLGFNSFNIALEAESGTSVDVGLTGEANYRRNGVLFYVSYAF